MRHMPLARSEELVVQALDEETLVYDQKNHQAHCLGKLASLVWRHCDGRSSLDAVAERIHRQWSIPADHEMVQLALQELAEADLLQERPLQPENGRRFSRRQLAARLGGGAAAFLLAPLITSLTTRSALAQASPRTTTTGPPTSPQ
jgi:Coenzyme PQQ synthesis protein D (PqqD)